MHFGSVWFEYIGNCFMIYYAEWLTGCLRISRDPNAHQSPYRLMRIYRCLQKQKILINSIFSIRRLKNAYKQVANIAMICSISKWFVPIQQCITWVDYSSFREIEKQWISNMFCSLIGSFIEIYTFFCHFNVSLFVHCFTSGWLDVFFSVCPTYPDSRPFNFMPWTIEHEPSNLMNINENSFPAMPKIKMFNQTLKHSGTWSLHKVRKPSLSMPFLILSSFFFSIWNLYI